MKENEHQVYFAQEIEITIRKSVLKVNISGDTPACNARKKTARAGNVQPRGNKGEGESIKKL